MCKLHHSGVIASNSKVVVDAREARARAKVSVVLSNPNIKYLSRTLLVSKQWNSTILDTAQLRRIHFLEAEQPREYMRFIRGTDQRIYEIPHMLQTVIVRAPMVESESFEGVTRVVVDPYPALSRTLRGRHTGNRNMDIDINFPNYAVLASVQYKWEGLPAVNEAEFERLKVLERVGVEGLR